MKTFQYGFELEGFYRNPETAKIGIPPEKWPHDGMAGLVEIRTIGGHSLNGAWKELCSAFAEVDIATVDVQYSEHVFSPEERRELRKRVQQKVPADIQNIYGKKPRALGNKTIASFQINISNLEAEAYTIKAKGKKDFDSYVPDRFGLFDIPKVVKAFDEEFAQEILGAKRQPGEYCIKGNRLEYRSLPNSVWSSQLDHQQTLMKRIEKVMKVAE